MSGFSLSTSIAARICEASGTRPSRRDLSSLAHIGFGGEMIVPDIILRLHTEAYAAGAHKI